MKSAFLTLSSSFEDEVISSSLHVGQHSHIDFTGADIVTGSFSGEGEHLIHISASYLNPGINVYLSQSYISSVTGSTQPPYQPATIWWDDVAKTYAIYSDNSEVSLQIGQEQWLRSYAGENITNGAAVYISSSNGNLPIVKLAFSDGLINSIASQAIGLATQYIASGSIGIITTVGQVHNLDTSAYVPGQLIYLSNIKSGSFIANPPEDPHQLVAIGYVVSANSGSGVVQVNISNFGSRNFPFIGMTVVPSISIANGTASIGTGSVNLCTTSDGNGYVKNYQLATASFIISSDFLNTQYIIASYNGGKPIYQLVSDKSYVDNIQTANVYIIEPDITGNISYTGYDNPGTLLANKLLTRIEWTRQIERDSGLLLNVSNSFYSTITSGNIWNGVNKIELSAVNSAIDRTILIAHSASVWSGSLITQLTNTQYDNGINVVSLGGGGNHWTVNYIYRGIGETQSITYVMYGDDYILLTDAQSSQPPTPPSELLSSAILIGRVIYKKSVATPVKIDSAFVNTFVTSGITNHNELNNIQGGTTNEYYHFTSESYAPLSLGSASYANTASWTNNSLISLQTNYSTQSLFTTQSVFSTQSLNATRSIQSIYATQSLYATRSIYATQSLNATSSIQSIYATQSLFTTQSTYATSSLTAYCIIYDDCIHLLKAKQNQIINELATQNRHRKITNIYVLQKWNTYLPTLIRSNLDLISIFRSDNKKELNSFFEEMNMDEDKIRALYEYATKEEYSFLHINTYRNPAKFYRKFDEIRYQE